MHQDFFRIPPARQEAIRRIGQELRPGRRAALTTNINADGDGCGSEAAMARLLAQRGLQVHIVNPTPWPDLFSFLLDDDVVDRSDEGTSALAGIDLLIVLDISDVKRLGALTETVRSLTVPRLVIDHHVPSDDRAGDVVLADTSACATGELVYDLACELQLEITPGTAKSLY